MADLGRPRIGQPVLWVVCAALCGGMIGAIDSPSVLAQFGQFQMQPQTPEEILRQRVPYEPQIQSEISEARELLAAGDFDAAIDKLQPLLEMGDDFFELEPDMPASSALDRVESLLRGMPPEAIETYRRRFEPLASQRLAQARQRSDLTELLEVVRTYPLTRAAFEAVESAGALAFDQGETALAARMWERLLPEIEVGPLRTEWLIRISQAWTLAGQPEMAAEYVRELSPLALTAPLEYEGKLLTPPIAGDATWLNKVFGPVVPLVPHRERDWRMGGGHPRRWGDGPLVSALQRGSWAYPLIDSHDTYITGRNEKFQSVLKFLETKYLRSDHANSAKRLPWLVGAPLVDGETVLVQGMASLKALDARTGQIRWSGVVKDDTFLYFSERNYFETGTNPNNDHLVELYLGQRAWMNQAAASLASDGRQVYAVSCTGMIRGALPQGMFMRNRMSANRNELTPPNDNRLLAYDLQSGLLKWESGGPSVAVPFDEDGQPAGESRRLGGAFFLGAPLPVDGQLFVLAEDRGQIRLFSLSPETGEAEWSLPLLNPDSPIGFDEARRMYGLSPSYAGGLLICPTGDGMVVAVDPLRRRMEWFQQYQTQPATTDPRMARMMRMQIQIQMQGSRAGNESMLDHLLKEDRWYETTPLLTAGRILLPTAENHMLYCLDLETGKTLWEHPRGEGLYLAACTDRHCLVVGRRSLQAIGLTDGKVKWSQEIPTPTGRGVVSGNQYLLPVATHEILSLNLRTGKILARSSLNPAHTAGSLVAAGDRLLMQTTSEVVGLRSLSDMTEELARTQNDAGTRASALAEQGELLLFQGQEPEAVALLQESLKLQESAPTRRLLVWSQLERLKADYAGSKGLIAELKQTVTDPDQRRMLNRLHAEGLEKSGDSLTAFREYLDLVQSVGQSDTLMELSIDHRVRDDRWLRGRLTHLYSLSSGAIRLQMQQSLKAAIAAQEATLMPHFAGVLGIDLAPQLHLELALANGLDQFKTERVLWTLSESCDPALRGPAVGRLLRHELALKRIPGPFIGPLLAELQHGLANVECEPGVTGTALLGLLRQDAVAGPQLQKLELPVTVPTFTARLAGASLQQRQVFPVLGDRRGPFDDWLFTAEFAPTRNVQCSDASGTVRHTFNIDALGQMPMQQLRYVQTDPQLVLLAFRDRFAVVSPMDSGGNQFQTRFIFAPVMDGFNRMQVRPADVKPGVRDAVYPTADGSYLYNVGPLTHDTLCYLSGDELFAVQPQTKDSKLQWKRSGVTPGSEICADSEYVVLIPPLLDRLVVYRAADGEFVVERSLPKGRVDRQRADWGRLFLVSRTEKGDGTSPDRITWAMYDPVTDKEAWSLTLPAGTLWNPVEGSDLAFLEPDGTLRRVDDQTGQLLWTTSIPVQTVPPTEFTIHEDQDRLYVHTWHAPTAGQDYITEPTLPNGSTVRVNGIAAALDRHSGKTLWSRPMEQQLFRPYLPVGCGVLAYAAQRRHEDPQNGPKTSMTLEFLTRRTGEPVPIKDRITPGGTGEGWARLPSGVLLLRVSGKDYRLTWNGEPAAEGTAPAQEEPVPPQPPDAPIKLQ
jgi:outer membrane protein assembly factor BamB